MLRDKAVDLLKNRLAQRTGTAINQQIIDEMVFVQENILEGDATLPWFTISTEQTLSTISGDEAVALPTDYLSDWEYDGIYMLELDAVTRKAMVKEDWNRIVDQVTGDGRPYYYDIVGDNILLRQKPDAIYTMYWRYHQKQTDLTGAYGDASNVENNWLKHASDWLIAETGIIIARQYLQSEKMVQLFGIQAAIAKKRVMDKNVMLEENLKQRFMEG